LLMPIKRSKDHVTALGDGLAQDRHRNAQSEWRGYAPDFVPERRKGPRSL